MSEAQEYVARLMGHLAKYANDPAKCAEIMAHDQRDGAGLRDLFNYWDDEEYERDHPDEYAEALSHMDIGGALDRIDRELEKGTADVD